ncbi:DUF397 domain-containing protein [Streptomyces pini]|uniref:DUF397 domain-containing protein n=1 Tax=Streptomyces pini TaxID=1520580 RepID=A0A1I4JQ36_9ACTN|nr:DUF397 domain-containing protein [Streptomyces pini]SFL68640.1 protein of unknown function [Streptomyces pini]
MVQYSNGVPASSITDVVWLKSSASNATGNCVELAALPGGEVALRNSRHPAGPALVFTREEIAAFVTGAKGSEFDRLA